MSREVSSTLSLVAQFDDICRFNKVVSVGCEKEFSTFVGSQTKLLQKFKKAESENNQLENNYKELSREHSQCEHRIKHMRNLLSEEITRRKEIENEKDILVRQISLIKDIIFAEGFALNDDMKAKLMFLNNAFDKHHTNIDEDNQLSVVNESVESLLSPADVDKTIDDLEIDESFSRKRHSETNLSSPSNCIPSKKNKFEFPVKNLSRSSSNVSEMDVDRIPVSAKMCNKFEAYNKSTLDLSTKTETSEYSTDPANISNMPKQMEDLNYSYPSQSPATSTPTHVFSSKRVIRAETCHICGPAKFPNQVLKCSSCGITCHPKCKEKCPTMCTPNSSTPQSNPASLTDYTPPSSPMVPPFVVKCICEIEKRGLNHIGIYRKPGRKSEVRMLKEKLLKENKSPLKNNSIHVVCGALKEFFQSLSDPLIPRASWKMFVNASEVNDEVTCNKLLIDAVCNLPKPNRETLAYLIPHLQRVAGSPKCKMPVENLATVFGPTVVGYSSENPTVGNILEETGKQINVMKKLLKVPSDSWLNISNLDRSESSESIQTNSIKLSPAPVRSRLGPLYASFRKKRTPSLSSPLTSSENVRCNQQKKSRFFLSPLLK